MMLLGAFRDTDVLRSIFSGRWLCSVLPLAFLIAAVGFPLATHANETVQGDGRKVSQERTVKAFSRVELRTHLDAEIVEGKEQAVKVTLDRNLLQFIELRVEGEKLVIDSLGNFRWSGPGNVQISVPELKDVAIRGSGKVRIAGSDAVRDVTLATVGSGDIQWSGKAQHLRADIQGSGEVHLSGEARELSVSAEGSGGVKARSLSVSRANLMNNGSGDIEVTLDGGPLAAIVSGSGTIIWHGTATVAESTVRGSGSIHHR